MAKLTLEHVRAATYTHMHAHTHMCMHMHESCCCSPAISLALPSWSSEFGSVVIARAVCATYAQRESRSNQSVSQSVNPTHSGQADRKREQGGHENTKTSERRRTLRVRLVCMEPSLMASQTVRNSCERTAPGARRLYILTGCAPACRQSIPPFSHDRCRHMWH